MHAWAHAHLVALLEVLHPPAVCHEVDGLASIARVHHLAVVCGVDEGGDLLAGLLVGRGGKSGEVVHASVHVGIVAFVVVVHRIEHHRGLLRGGGVVEVDQVLAIHLLVQNREVLAQCLANLPLLYRLGLLLLLLLLLLLHGGDLQRHAMGREVSVHAWRGFVADPSALLFPPFRESSSQSGMMSTERGQVASIAGIGPGGAIGQLACSPLLELTMHVALRSRPFRSSRLEECRFIVTLIR